jgi:hypothetical protein
MLLSKINNAYLNSIPMSAMYLGAIKVWPIYDSGAFWYGFNSNSCVTLTLNSTSAIPISGIIWGDGSVSGISLGTATYRDAYGTAVCV